MARRAKVLRPGVEDPYAPIRIAPESIRHDLCVDHVRVEGLTEPVCILKADDREAVLNMVEEVMGRVRRSPSRPSVRQEVEGNEDADGEPEHDGHDRQDERGG